MTRHASLVAAIAHVRYMAIMSRHRQIPAPGQHTTGVAVAVYDHLGIFAYYSPAHAHEWQIRLWHPLRQPHRAECNAVGAVFGPGYIWHATPVTHHLPDLTPVAAVELAGALLPTPAETEATAQWIQQHQNYQFPAKHQTLRLLRAN